MGTSPIDADAVIREAPQFARDHLIGWFEPCSTYEKDILAAALLDAEYRLLTPAFLAGDEAVHERRARIGERLRALMSHYGQPSEFAVQYRVLSNAGRTWLRLDGTMEVRPPSRGMEPYLVPPVDEVYRRALDGQGTSVLQRICPPESQTQAQAADETDPVTEVAASCIALSHSRIGPPYGIDADEAVTYCDELYPEMVLHPLPEVETISWYGLADDMLGVSDDPSVRVHTRQNADLTMDELICPANITDFETCEQFLCVRGLLGDGGQFFGGRRSRRQAWCRLEGYAYQTDELLNRAWQSMRAGDERIFAAGCYAQRVDELAWGTPRLAAGQILSRLLRSETDAAIAARFRQQCLDAFTTDFGALGRVQ
jgi:hypothetical protein